MAIKLHVPVGTEATVDTRLYTADADGVLTVSDDDAAALLATPGFTLDTDDAPPSGFVRMNAPKGATSVSVGGVAFIVADNGTVIVPADNELAAHGFTPSVVVPGVDLAPVEPAPEPAPAPAPAPKPVDPPPAAPVAPPATPPAPVAPVAAPTTPATDVAPVAAPAGE